MNIFICGWNTSRAIAEAARRELATMSEVVPQLDLATMWFQATGEGVIAGSMHTPTAALGAKRYLHPRPDGVTFFDGVLADPNSDALSEDAEIVESHWDALTERFEGNFVAVRVLTQDASVEIKNDPLGQAPI